jgi:hypothetical protein
MKNTVVMVVVILILTFMSKTAISMDSADRIYIYTAVKGCDFGNCPIIKCKLTVLNHSLEIVRRELMDVSDLGIFDFNPCVTYSVDDLNIYEYIETSGICRISYSRRKTDPRYCKY